MADVILVEEGDLGGAGVIHDAALGHVEALAQPGETGDVGHHGRDADGEVGGGVGDGMELSAILIGPGVI